MPSFLEVAVKLALLMIVCGCGEALESMDEDTGRDATNDASLDASHMQPDSAPTQDIDSSTGDAEFEQDVSSPDAEFEHDVSSLDASLPQDGHVSGPCVGQPENAVVDQCGVCDTDPDNDCTQDCAGEWGGAATVDQCGVCDAEPGNDCAQDCAGELGGAAMVDQCGVCDTDPSNDCAQDCAGEWGGGSVSDECGVCDGERENDNATCEVTPMRVYMHPTGDDQHDGQSPEQSVLSLARVNTLLTQRQPRRPVEVVIALGTYFGQRVNWTYVMPNHGVTFTRPEGVDGRPVFDGCRDGQCLGGTWFQIQSSTGQPTRLSFMYLQIENYGTALSFNGNRNDEAASNGENRIYGCYLSRIGNVFNPELNPTTAAIRFVNSDDNVIANTHFVDIINTRSSGLLHGVYIAHMSDRNRIERNRFLRNSGDPVRLRDFSNDNIINDNRFIQSGIEAGYTDWYCDHDARDDCTKPDPECPSWNNQFRDNELDGDYLCGQLGTFHYFQGEATTGCAPPTPDARRLRTSGNETLSPGCQD